MMKFISGLLTGGFIGIFIIALVNAGSRGNDE